MSKTYEAECPFCDEEIDIADCDPKELAEDKGCVSGCPECGEEIEFDYDETTDTLIVTPGQVEEEDEEGEMPGGEIDDEFEDEEDDDEG